MLGEFVSARSPGLCHPRPSVCVSLWPRLSLSVSVSMFVLLSTWLSCSSISPPSTRRFLFPCLCPCRRPLAMCLHISRSCPCRNSRPCPRPWTCLWPTSSMCQSMPIPMCLPCVCPHASPCLCFCAFFRAVVCFIFSIQPLACGGPLVVAVHTLDVVSQKEKFAKRRSDQTHHHVRSGSSGASCTGARPQLKQRQGKSTGNNAGTLGPPLEVRNQPCSKRCFAPKRRRKLNKMSRFLP